MPPKRPFSLLAMQRERATRIEHPAASVAATLCEESRDSPIGESQDSPHNTTHMHYHYRIF